ncbi:hypothetical protein QD172_01780 [Cobetia sp. 10Alg 146]|uniref:hypothetical protein n=1 Tax=Cobetia sp. 10Alg 146 TaxID=3040019 RepID=UPI0024491386|nr:hypothetical protein [Cobetia sp. 10Alg 146]MDH2289980.1 hypothetical protein [Cobetia sp. 10Alg 146]
MSTVPTISQSVSPNDNAAKVLKAQWERYRNAYTPVENQLAGSIGEDLTRPAMAQTQAANERSNAANARMKSRYGLADISGAPVAANQQRASALATSDAYNTANLAQIDRNQNIRTSLTDVGQQLVGQATGGLVNSAGMASSRNQAYEAQKASADQAQDAQQTQMLATAAMAAMMFM